MAFNNELGLLIRARYPLIYIPTIEEERVEKSIALVAAQLENRPIYTWDFVEGYDGNPNDKGFGKRNPLQALEFIDKLAPNAPGIFVLRDFHRFLEDVSVARKLRNLGRKFKSEPKNIVMLAPQIAIPADLSEAIALLEFPLPTATELQTEIDRLLQATGQTLTAQSLDDLVRAGQGLSLDRIRRVLWPIMGRSNWMTSNSFWPKNASPSARPKFWISIQPPPRWKILAAWIT
jgi:hypothetical protein